MEEGVGVGGGGNSSCSCRSRRTIYRLQSRWPMILLSIHPIDRLSLLANYHCLEGNALMIIPYMHTFLVVVVSISIVELSPHSVRSRLHIFDLISLEKLNFITGNPTFEPCKV